LQTSKGYAYDCVTGIKGFPIARESRCILSGLIWYASRSSKSTIVVNVADRAIAVSPDPVYVR
jgi:hypothetical protein